MSQTILSTRRSYQESKWQTVFLNENEEGASPDLEELIAGIVKTVRLDVIEPIKALLSSPGGGGSSQMGFPSGPMDEDFSQCAARVRTAEPHGPSAVVNELFVGLGEKLRRRVPEPHEKFQVVVPEGFGRMICQELRSVEARIVEWVRGRSGDLGQCIYVPKATRQWLLDQLMGHALQNALGIVALDADFFAHAELEEFALAANAPWEQRLALHEDTDFAALVKGIRVKHGLTQAELAERLREQNPDSSYRQAHISRWENGSTPSEQSIQALKHFVASL